MFLKFMIIVIDHSGIETCDMCMCDPASDSEDIEILEFECDVTTRDVGGAGRGGGRERRGGGWNVR